MKKGLILAALAVSLSACSAEMTTQVKVTGGTVEGYADNGLTIFKGIPFAAPPTGELRWKAPQPVIPWDGVREAKTYSKGPYQSGNPENFSEDCLYLNIWTPAVRTDEKLPVLVWIYGGGFAMGWTGDPSNDCEALARKHGDVILASINYRVGQMGFFSHPLLDAENEQHVSGNYGILDQIAGLEWIQENISRFGGDPDRVTIFGESAGGISVSMLCASPLAKGLFSGAISQSGGSFGPARATTYPGENMKTLKMAQDDCMAVARELGATTLEQLRALPPSAFSRYQMGAGGWPVVDGYVIPGDQFEMYEQGRFNDVNVLIGYNSDEGASFSGGFGGQTPNHADGVRTRYGKYADALLEAYPVEPDGRAGKTARDLMRDAAFGWQTWSWARLQAAVGKSKVFLYYFDQPQRGAEGSPHGQDVGFVFQHMNQRSSQSDLALSSAMGDYWLNFAKYGTPNAPGSDLPVWPEFSNDDPQAMHLSGPTPFAGPVPSLDALNVLDGYFKWRRTDEGKAWAK